MNIRARREASKRMKALWATPEFREAASSRARQRMKALWATPGFVDRQLQAAVRNWSKPDYQQRQGRRIQRGERPVPLANQPLGEPCPLEQCIRQGPHNYHCRLEGNLADATLRLTGWNA